jgi:hypothetical protein
MGQSRTVREWLNSVRGEPPNSRGLPAIVASMVAVPIPVLAWLLPPPLVLPISSLVLLSGAAIAALFAWLHSTEPGSAEITLWDLAGAFAFIGLAAGGLSEPMHVAHLFGVALPAP